jgi:hypothetical protein
MVFDFSAKLQGIEVVNQRYCNETVFVQYETYKYWFLPAGPADAFIFLKNLHVI